jgi:nucleoside-diphosphate-sugar epimerase
MAGRGAQAMNVTLITGADGHVGKAFGNWLLGNSDHELLLYVRTLADDPRCDIVSGDLRDVEPFAGVDGKGVTGILHCAAVTNFGVDRETARAVNIVGTEKLIRFASSCPRLARFGLVSSLYAVGLRSGDVPETVCDDTAPFANHYEWSKWNAEALVHRHRDLPWQIYRVATILAEDESGIVVQQNVIHNTLRLLYYGLLSVIPGNPDSRVYMVSTKFVANAIGRLFLDADSKEMFHISDAGADAMTLGAIADAVYESFLTDSRFARQRILKPLFCDQDSFETLVRGIGQFGGAVSQALDSVAPFAAQLYSDKDVRTNRATAALNGLRTPDSKGLLNAVTDYLVQTRWGLGR